MQTSLSEHSLNGDRDMEILMIELGHKMPTFCKSLSHPDHEILNYLQFTETKDIGDLDDLPIEKVLSPFLVLVVCEKIYREYSLVDAISQSEQLTDSSESIYAFYNQVLTDFDCLLSLLTGITDSSLPLTTDKFQSDDDYDKTRDNPYTAPRDRTPGTPGRKVSISNSDKRRLHRRTVHIIEDLCTLIGIRLAMLDVLNSLELEKASGPSFRLLRTLDRIIACTKSVRSKHALPVIERAVLEAKAVRLFLLSKEAMQTARYAESTTLILDFKVLVSSLLLESGSGSSLCCAGNFGREFFVAINDNNNDDNDDNDNYKIKKSVSNHDMKGDIKKKYRKNIKNVPVSSIEAVLLDLLTWLTTNHKITFKDILTRSEHFITHHEREHKHRNSLSIFKKIKSSKVEKEFSASHDVHDIHGPSAPSSSSAPVPSGTRGVGPRSGIKVHVPVHCPEDPTASKLGTSVASDLKSDSGDTSSSSSSDSVISETRKYDFSKEHGKHPNAHPNTYPNTRTGAYGGTGVGVRERERGEHRDHGLEGAKGFVCPPRAEWGKSSHIFVSSFS